MERYLDIIEKIIWSAFIIAIMGLLGVWGASFGYYCVTELHEGTVDQISSIILAIEVVVACLVAIVGGVYSIWTE